MERQLSDQASTKLGIEIKKLVLPLAFGLLLPTAALAQVNPKVASQCKDARDFYGCVWAITTPPQSGADRTPLVGVMGQMAGGLISGPTFRNAPTNVSRGVNPIGLVEGGSLAPSCGETKQDSITYGSSPGIDRSG